jgi:IrrE N-terminal-like domain
VRRGFKAQAERLASSIRADMGLGPAEPVRAVTIAEHLGVEVRPADQLVDRSRLQELQDLQFDAFSGATFRLPSGRFVVVSNPLNDPGRSNSDIAHEISHIVLEHPARTVERVGGLNFFTCDAEEEQEANWLAGCLLLPQPLLVKEARTGATAQDLAKRHEVSEQMATWRLNASGVLVQLRRARG